MKILFPRIPDDWPVPQGGWPDWLWTVPYVAANHPLAEALPPIEAGANCQRYAFAVLELFGRAAPPRRSSELWSEPTLEHVERGTERPLDLVLFNGGAEPFGAHLAIVMGPDRLLHLSEEVGRPDLWGYADFAARARYSTVVGIVRVGE